MTVAAGVPLTPPRGGLARVLRLYRGLNRRGLVWPPLILAVAVAYGTRLGDASQLKWTLWIAYGLLALSLDFVWGKAGIFSFGQTAMFGLGGYCYGVVAINYFAVTNESWTALVAAIAIGGFFAALLGYFMFWGRLSDVYLAIITLAVTLVLYTVMTSTAGPQYHIGDARLGGFNGMPAIPLLTVSLPGGSPTTPLTNYQLYVFAVVAAGVVYMGLRLLLAGRFGRVLSGLRENELRMELLGYDVRRSKLAAFTIGGAIAGLGGGLFAAWGTFINPSVFTLAQAALVVIWVMVGGRGTLAGAFVGVIVVQWVTERADTIVSEQTPLILGVILILVVLLLPGGIIPNLTRLARHLWRLVTRPKKPPPLERRIAAAIRPEPRSSAAASSAPSGPGGDFLAVEGLSRRFGGVNALEGVSLTFRGPGAYAVIGPNGAGKSTFFNVLIGRHAPSAGRVWLGGTELTRLQTFRRARLGLGIKLQVPSLFFGLSVAENIWLAGNASADPVAAAARAEEVLGSVGLLGQLDTPAAELSHGGQQWVEIAMVLAVGPSTILLDEPTAGMTREEKAKTTELIGRLADDRTVIVVEHDMAFIRSLGVPVTMFHQGKVFRTGSFDEIHRDAEVIDVYLGRSGRAEPA